MENHYYTALADERRRAILASIQDGTPHDVEMDGQTSDENATRLAHVHLPMLEGAGLVRWDKETHRVTRGRNYDEIEPLVEFLRTKSAVASD